MSITLPKGHNYQEFFKSLDSKSIYQQNVIDMDVSGYNYAVEKQVAKFKPTDVTKSLSKAESLFDERGVLKGLRDPKTITPRNAKKYKNQKVKKS